MTPLRRAVRQTLTIARRDFIATVFTPTFLIFLLAPLLMIGFGAIGGLGAATMSSTRAEKAQIVVVLPPGGAADDLRTIDTSLRGMFRRDAVPPPLSVEPPAGDPAAQARALFARKSMDVVAVMTGPLARPTITHAPDRTRTAAYLAQLAEQTLRAERIGGTAPLSVATKQVLTATRTTSAGRNQAAMFSVAGIFFLSILLTSQAVGTMAEEKSNKVIEVLAAAVPLESVFLGKLIGMFGVAVLFVTFWGTLVTNAAAFAPAGMARAFSDVGLAVGFGTYVILFLAYFTMAYLLLGAVFLGLGAQASTMREIQMMSLPITFFQFGMFGLASAAANNPGGWIAIVAEVFPFSSPFAMAAHAANRPELWPHLLALAWQLLWVAITIAVAARLFRRGVLQSGQPRRKRRRGIDTAVS